MVTKVNWTYCGDHFTIYTTIKSLCFTPETNVILHVKLYLNQKINIFLKKRERITVISTALKLKCCQE